MPRLPRCPDISINRSRNAQELKKQKERNAKTYLKYLIMIFSNKLVKLQVYIKKIKPYANLNFTDISNIYSFELKNSDDYPSQNIHYIHISYISNTLLLLDKILNIIKKITLCKYLRNRTIFQYFNNRIIKAINTCAVNTFNKNSNIIDQLDDIVSHFEANMIIKMMNNIIPFNSIIFNKFIHHLTSSDYTYMTGKVNFDDIGKVYNNILINNNYAVYILDNSYYSIMEELSIYIENIEVFGDRMPQWTESFKKVQSYYILNLRKILIEAPEEFIRKIREYDPELILRAMKVIADNYDPKYFRNINIVLPESPAFEYTINFDIKQYNLKIIQHTEQCLEIIKLLDDRDILLSICNAFLIVLYLDDVEKITNNN
jgi:hypothetical protein